MTDDSDIPRLEAERRTRIPAPKPIRPIGTAQDLAAGRRLMTELIDAQRGWTRRRYRPRRKPETP